MSGTLSRLASRNGARASERLRMVLDTNVWLDWLVFDDPGITPIRKSVNRGAAGIFISSACAAELQRVLAYPFASFTLDTDAQAKAMAQCRAIARKAEHGARPHVSAELPRCADPDDQMFLELARDCDADVLITKDRDLLALATRKVKPLPFRILTPRAFARDACYAMVIG